MSTNAVKTTPESYQLTPQESQFLETLKNTQGDIFETLDRKEVFHGLKEIPYTILRGQLAEQQLIQLFPKSHQLRQIINQFDHEMAYFKMRYSDPITVQRFANASEKSFDEAKEYLDNILATARIISKEGLSESRNRHFQKDLENHAVLSKSRTISKKMLHRYSKILTSGLYIKKTSQLEFEKEKKVYSENKKSFAMHELSHVVNSGYGEISDVNLKMISDTNLLHGKMDVISQIKTNRYLGLMLIGSTLLGTYSLYSGSIPFALLQYGLAGFMYHMKDSFLDYQKKPEEIHSHIMEIRYTNNIQPCMQATWNEIYKNMKNYNNPNVRELLFLVKSLHKEREFINLINTSF